MFNAKGKEKYAKAKERYRKDGNVFEFYQKIDNGGRRTSTSQFNNMLKSSCRRKQKEHVEQSLNYSVSQFLDHYGDGERAQQKLRDAVSGKCGYMHVKKTDRARSPTS